MERSNDLLRAAREKRGWTQAEIAEKIGTTSANVSRWENGITFPGHFYRQKLCRLYGSSARELGLTHESEEREIPGAADSGRTLCKAEGAENASFPHSPQSLNVYRRSTQNW